MNKTRRCVQICLVAWGSKNYLGSRKIFRIKKQIITVFVILIFSPLYQGKNIEANLTFACFFQNLDGQKKSPTDKRSSKGMTLSFHGPLEQ